MFDLSESSSVAVESRVCDINTEERIDENVELAAVTLDLVTVMMQPESSEVDLLGLLGALKKESLQPICSFIILKYVVNTAMRSG